MYEKVVIFFLYYWILDGNLFVVDCVKEGIQPYILGDKMHPLLLQLMVPHKVEINM
jgi:hypothetical protein